MCMVSVEKAYSALAATDVSDAPFALFGALMTLIVCIKMICFLNEGFTDLDSNALQEEKKA